LESFAFGLGFSAPLGSSLGWESDGRKPRGNQQQTLWYDPSISIPLPAVAHHTQFPRLILAVELDFFWMTMVLKHNVNMLSRNPKMSWVVSIKCQIFGGLAASFVLSREIGRASPWPPASLQHLLSLVSCRAHADKEYHMSTR
jgi:hypothetical protein